MRNTLFINTVVNTVIETKYKTRYKTKYRTKIVKEKADRNAVSLLLGRSKTKLHNDKDGNTNFVTNEYEFDVGLQYQRLFGDSFHGSLSVTKNRSLYLGLGINY